MLTLSGSAGRSGDIKLSRACRVGCSFTVEGNQATAVVGNL